MFKKFFVSLFTFSIALFLLGCNSDSDTSQDDSTPSTESSSTVEAGDYSGTAQGFGGEISVVVSIGEDGEITHVEIDADEETENIGGEAAVQLAETIVEYQSVSVDAVSGATVTSEAVIAAITAALESSGLLLSNYQTEIEKDGEDETLETEIVVVGAGGAGTAAALAAAQDGRDVIVIEKTPAVGGNTKLSSGFFAIDSSIQQDENVDLSVDVAVNRLLEFNDYLSNGPLTRNIVERSGDTVDWLQENGLEFYLQEETTQFAHEDDPYKYRVYHKYADTTEGFNTIYSQLEELGAELYVNTTFEELIFDGEKVTGIVASKADGGTLTVNAKAVIVTTGGYGTNDDAIKDVMNDTYLNHLGVANSGEGLQAMEDIGAIDWDSTGLLHGAQLAESDVAQDGDGETLPGFSETSLSQILASPLLWVDPYGERFVNEDVVYDTAFWANAAYSVGGKYYIVLDEATLEEYTKGTEMLISQSGPGAHMELDDFVNLAEQAVEAGTAFKGETLEELAENTNMDADVLAASVERYNEMVESNNDTDYDKDEDSLLYPVDSGPFYAFDCRGVILGTIGGVRVSQNLEVIDQDSQPITGLYTGGSNAGGYYTGKGYPPYEGLASGFAWTSGRIAGETASEFVSSLVE